MKQVLRRIVYLLLGMQPAFIGTAIMLFALGPLAVIALAGMAGLAIATAAHFPVSRGLYWIMSAFLICGLILELPFFVWVLHDLATGGGLTENLLNAMLAGWVVLGPSACALHALWRGRCEPDHSFKPASLRGAT